MERLLNQLMGQVFGAFLDGNPALLKAVCAFEGPVEVKDRSLLFTLPGLYAFLCEHFQNRGDEDMDRGRAGYLCFRTSLYRSSTNEQLREFGGQVFLHSVGATHDQSVYRLDRSEDAAKAADSALQ